MTPVNTGRLDLHTQCNFPQAGERLVWLLIRESKISVGDRSSKGLFLYLEVLSLRLAFNSTGFAEAVFTGSEQPLA